jgi:hypothetical protein
MSVNQKKGMYCQSCGMPMSTSELFGTNSDGSSNSEYCTYCFQKGDFTLKVSKDAFIDMQVKIAVEKMGLNEDQARTMANNVLPTLKRWKS